MPVKERMITSTKNPAVINMGKLRKSAKQRDGQNCFVVEGPRMFFEIPAERILSVYVTEKFRDKYKEKLRGRRYELVSEQVFAHLSDTKTPQGVICTVRRESITLEDILSAPGTPCLFLLENLQDPGNLGTIIRTAEGAGVTGIIVNRETVDPYNPKVIRSTMGSVFRVPLLIAQDLTVICDRLKTLGIPLYAAELGGRDFYREDFRGACAFLVGNEGKGLSDRLLGLSDHRIAIPMKGQVESLNAAAASAVLMYEVLRQRERSSEPQ